MLHSGTDALRNLPGAKTATRSMLLEVLARFVFERFIGGVDSVRRKTFNRDAFQTAWIQFHKLVNETDGAIAARFEDSGKFANWFLKVIKSRFLDVERRQRRRRSTSLTTLGKEPATYDNATEEAFLDVAKWFAEWCNQADLDKDERECFLLRFIEGVSSATIAEELGMDVWTVYRTTEYAKRKLQNVQRPELE